MNQEELNEIKEHYQDFSGIGGEAIRVLLAEVDRMRDALQETMKFNRLRNDRDAYLFAMAQWGLSVKWGADNEFTERPQASEFGLDNS